MPGPGPERLRERYRLQADWFRAERTRLLRKADILNCRRVLDLGTGTGELLGELRRRTRGAVIGLDRNRQALRLAAGPVVQAEAATLPFAGGVFDLVFAQMFFLWAVPLEPVLAEVRRVLARDGRFLIAAEPDYGGCIEYPARSGAFADFTDALRAEGADLQVGRKLGVALAKQGFEVEAGTHPARPLAAEACAADRIPGPGCSSIVRGVGVRFRYIPYFWFLARR